jgi:hypothetical protein
VAIQGATGGYSHEDHSLLLNEPCLSYGVCLSTLNFLGKVSLRLPAGNERVKTQGSDGELDISTKLVNDRLERESGHRSRRTAFTRFFNSICLFRQIGRIEWIRVKPHGTTYIAIATMGSPTGYDETCMAPPTAAVRHHYLPDTAILLLCPMSSLLHTHALPSGSAVYVRSRLMTGI